MFGNTKNLKQSLVDAGYLNQINQALKNLLRDQGYIKSLPEALNEWLGDQGYTGTYVERLRAWEATGFLLDDTAPVISGSSIDDSNDTVIFTTDEGGTLYWATSLTTESPAADDAGGWTGTTLETGSDTVATSGTTNFTADYTATTGATGNSRKLSYYIRDAAGNDSNVIAETFIVDVTAPIRS